MYETFYGLKENPFNLLPDPDYLFMSQGHENAYAHLEYAIFENKAFVVITGEVGAGKTTLINFLLDKVQPDLHVGLINNTSVAPKQFLKMVCQEFEVNVNGYNKAECLLLFNDFLLDQFEQNKRITLIVDEAQNLYPTTMEEIRMLSNFESEKQHLIQLILVGQPELQKKLQRNDLKQFTQRISVHYHLDHLEEEEVGPYIRHRLKVGGAIDSDIFDPEAIQAISQSSKGNPRIINILCDTSLVFGYADGARIIDKQIVEKVIQERCDDEIFIAFHRDKPPTAAPAPQKTVQTEPFRKFMRSIDSRMQRMEGLLEKIEQSLSKLANL